MDSTATSQQVRDILLHLLISIRRPPPPLKLRRLLTVAHPTVACCAAVPQFELWSSTPQRAPAGFASLSSSLLGQQQRRQQQQQEAEPRTLLRQPSQVPLFDLARAAAGGGAGGPVAETNLRVIRVAGDGRCMFRALAQGLARSQGAFLGREAEEQEAGERAPISKNDWLSPGLEDLPTCQPA